MYSMLGSSVAGGDVSGDNVGDVVAGAPRTGGGIGAAFVYSGSDGAVIAAHEAGPEAYGLEIGRGVAVISDLNGDGIADYAIGVPGGGSEPNGAVYLYSGKP